MRTTVLACFAALALLGCGRDLEAKADARPSASAGTQTVEVRNSCPEAVTIAISVSPPEPSTPTMSLGSATLARVDVEQGARIWLRYEGRYDEERSIIPTAAVEIAYQCNAIYRSERGR